MSWAILREKSFYPVKTQARIINAYALLHNHIRREISIDPIKDEMSDVLLTEENSNEGEMIDHIVSTNAWTQFRDDMAQEMWDQSRA